MPLDASYAEGYVLNQVYFNSGTWRRVHRQTELAPGEHEFIASDVMTYLAFFQADERGGRPYETWSGTLGFNPAEVTIHRIDRGEHADLEAGGVLLVEVRLDLGDHLRVVRTAAIEPEDRGPTGGPGPPASHRRAWRAWGVGIRR